MILAAGIATAFYSEVAILIVAAAAVAYVGFRMGLMPIVSFLIAGALIGPRALGLVEDKELIEATAEMGSSICMTCGYVGCCNDSKNQHANKHHATSDHPIIRSFEPGENWAWCFVDQKML